VHRILSSDVSVQLGRSATGSVALRVANAAFALAASILLARLLGPEGYGVYAFAFSIVMLLALPAQAGLPTLVVREVARYEVDGRWRLIRGLLRRSNQAVGLLAAVIGLGGLAILMSAGRAYGGDLPSTLLWALILLPIMALGNLRGAALRGLRRVVQGQLPEYVIRPGLFVSCLLIVGLLDLVRPETVMEMSPARAMAIHAAAAFCAYLVGIALLRRGLPAPVRKGRPDYRTAAWLKTLLPLTLLAGMEMINNQVDVVLLGFLRTAGEVGIYRVAWQVSLPVVFTLTAVNLVVAPHFARAWQNADKQRLQRLATWSARVAASLAIPAAAVLIGFGTPLLGFVFGREFAAGGAALTILCIGQLCNAAAGSVGTILNMTGHERDTMLGIGIAAVTNVTLNLLLIPPFGIVGAATATTVSMVLWNLILFRRVRHRLGIVSAALPRRTQVERR